MKLINAEKVSHIIAIKEKQGVWSSWGYWTKMIYLPYRKHKWWEFDKETLEGFYEGGINSHLGGFISTEKLKATQNKWFIKNNELYTYPQILIYLGKDGYYGNPFPLKSGEERGKTKERFERHFQDRIENDIEFKRRVLELKGKTLGCFCKQTNKEVWCHGDVYVEYLENN